MQLVAAVQLHPNVIETVPHWNFPLLGLHNNTPISFSHAFIPARSQRVPASGGMRIFLAQTAKGLFASSGGYKANFNVLRRLASRGHTVAQICFAYENEVERYTERLKQDDFESNLRYSTLVLPGENGAQIVIPVHTFTDEHGIHMVVLNCKTFQNALPDMTLSPEIAKYIEVGMTP